MYFLYGQALMSEIIEFKTLDDYDWEPEMKMHSSTVEVLDSFSLFYIQKPFFPETKSMSDQRTGSTDCASLVEFKNYESSLEKAQFSHCRYVWWIFSICISFQSVFTELNQPAMNDAQ